MFKEQDEWLCLDTIFHKQHIYPWGIMVSVVCYLSKKILVLTVPLNVSLIRGIFSCLIRSKIEVHELCVLISLPILWQIN